MLLVYFFFFLKNADFYYDESSVLFTEKGIDRNSYVV